MGMRVLLIVFTLLWYGHAYSNERNERIISIIDQEIAEVKRLFEQTSRSDPSLLLRTAELHLERARLIKSIENTNFLKIPYKKRKKVDRSKYFKRSNQEFLKARNICLTILNKYKNYAQMHEVYYVLAFNYKEFNENIKAANFLRKAIAKAPKDSLSQLKSKLALAELEYNEGRYAQAIPLYESGINKVNDKWWTKDAHNLSWCYLRTRQYTKALNLMKVVYKRSYEEKYVDMKYAVKRDIGLFFVEANKINEGMNFYKKHGENFTQNMIDMANQLQEQGRFVQASRVLNRTITQVEGVNEQLNILMALMNLSDHFERSDELKKYALQIKQNYSKLSRNQQQQYNFLVEKHAALAQKKVISKEYKNNHKVKVKNAKLAVSLFSIMTELSIGSTMMNEFYIAETWYSIGYINSAAKQYDRAYEAAKKQGNSRQMMNSVDGMLSCLASKKATKETLDNYTEQTFVRYLDLDSKGPKSDKIFKRLFNYQIDHQRINEAEKTLVKYRQAFPSKKAEAEAMTIKLVDSYIKIMNLGKVRAIISQHNAGEIALSAATVDSFVKTLTKLEVKDIEKKLSQGNKADALRGYASIFYDPHASEKSKVNASYNLAALFYELKDDAELIFWANKSVDLMDAKSLEKFHRSYLTIGDYLADIGKAEQAINLKTKIYQKLCKVKFQGKSNLYRNIFVLSEAEKKYQKAVSIWKTRKNCSLNFGAQNESTFMLLENALKANSYEKASIFVQILMSHRKNYPRLIVPSSKIYEFYKKKNMLKEANVAKNNILKFYQVSLQKKYQLTVEGLDVVAHIKIQSATDLLSKLKKHRKLAFPEEVFNRILQEKLDLLARISKEVQAISEIGSADGIVLANLKLVQAYDYVFQSIKSFKLPKDKSQSYITSFKRSMNDVVVPLMNESRKLKADLKRYIKTEEILSEYNYRAFDIVDPPVLNGAGRMLLMQRRGEI